MAAVYNNIEQTGVQLSSDVQNDIKLSAEEKTGVPRSIAVKTDIGQCIEEKTGVSRSIGVQTDIELCIEEKTGVQPPSDVQNDIKVSAAEKTGFSRSIGVETDIELCIVEKTDGQPLTEEHSAVSSFIDAQTNFKLSIEEKPPKVDNIDLHDINDVLIHNNMILECKFVLKSDGALVPEFNTLNKSLSNMLKLNRKIVEVSDQDLRDLLAYGGPILAVKFLPYLSEACNMKFHRCTIEHYNKRRVFVPVKRNHDISTAIYYICDSSEKNIKDIFVTNYAYNVLCINHNYKALMQTSLHNTCKIQLYQELISNYIEQTKTLHFHQHLLLLSKWQEIYNCYVAIKRLGHRFTSADALAYSRCLIMLSKYSAAESLLTELSTDEMVKQDETLYLLAKAQRKRQKYSEAKSSIDKAVSVNSANKNLVKEQIIIDKLIKRTSSDEASSSHTIEHRKRAENCSSYNILSIDGGGIRGIMAAELLHKLERKTNRTCSSMFSMMAGTSTGAIIVTGLSAPKINNPTEPAYDASEIVKLYETCGRNIFVKKKRSFLKYRNLPCWLAPKYSSNGKKNLFKQYFGQTLLHECLTDIFIPAVRTFGMGTYSFTKESASSTPLVDVLMATTAAPTYFNPHCFNDTIHSDGGIQMNNPTMTAYTEAIKHVNDKEDIYVLSLGTGDYIELPELSVPNTKRDVFHYAKNRTSVIKVLIDSQQHNVDHWMSSLMNDEHYHRWQIISEEPIELDNYEPNIVDQLKNMADEYWEEMEAYDDKNRLNRLIQRLKQE